MRALVVAVGLLVQGEAEACSCVANQAPCATMFSSTVFVGKALATTQTSPGATTTFELIETLHAVSPLEKSVVVSHLIIGSLCGLTFEPGVSYVVYADGTPGQLSAGACSRTHRLMPDDEDVAFAHALPNREWAHVEGRLVRAAGHETLPLAGLLVHVLDAGVTSRASASGAFALELPPGLHTLTLLTDRATISAPPVVLRLPHPAACARPMVPVGWNGQVTGRTLTEDGGVVAGVELDAVAPGKARDLRDIATSGDDGTFRFTGLPPGVFVIGVSLPEAGGTSPTSPWPARWAPGVSTLAKARRYRLSPGGRVGPIDFVLPSPLARIAIKVLVTSKTGPATSKWVTVTPDGGERSTSAATDSEGTVLVKELAGRFTVRACEADLKRCVETKRKLEADSTVELLLE